MNTTTLAGPLTFPSPVDHSAFTNRADGTASQAKDTLQSRLPSLDGWRAISIVMVLGCHSALAVGFPAHLEKAFHHLFDGHLGVRFFFVISGMLITWLMLMEERKKQRVHLGNFYARRALRILPVYVVFLAVIGVIQHFTTCDHSTGNWIANITFTRNFYLNGNSITGSLWSLAVEEQFYLVWPFVFVALSPAARLKAMPWILAGTVTAAFVTRYFWHFPLAGTGADFARHVFQERSFFNNADSLAIGCMAALWMAGDEQRLRKRICSRPIAVFGLAVLLLLEPYAVHWLSDRAWMPSVLKGAGWAAWCGLGRTLQSIGFVVLVVQSIMLPTWGLYRCLNWRPLAAIGVLSYSIYIWQSIFYHNPANLGLPEVWWMTYPLWLVPVFAAAIVSYHCLEKPFLKLRHHFR